MADLIKLRKEIQRQGFCYSEIAKALNVTRSCISKKMKGEEQFAKNQIAVLVALLGLSEQEKEEIFFSNMVTTDNASEEKCMISVIGTDGKVWLFSEDERKVLCAETFKEIISILAAKKCTAKEAREILRYVSEHITAVSESATVRNTSEIFKTEDLLSLF